MKAEDEKGVPEENETRTPWKSRVSVNGALEKIHPTYAEIVADVLGFIGKKGVTYEAALYILDQSKEALRKCTLLQDEYTP
ncbi:hypothetical protein [Paenibacillus sp. FSL L8-0708]|uniref:hypothetical protein n=1 Tax=Paenibacillus sp. FSL L8-0708 TaxID=2975311 RepID=UPI0030FACD49